jgi:hypothetical protein
MKTKILISCLTLLFLFTGCKPEDKGRKIEDFKSIGTLIDHEFFNSEDGVKSYIWTTETKKMVYGIVTGTDKQDKVFESKDEIALYRVKYKTISYYKKVKNVQY